MYFWGKDSLNIRRVTYTVSTQQGPQWLLDFCQDVFFFWFLFRNLFICLLLYFFAAIFPRAIEKQVPLEVGQYISVERFGLSH